MPREFRAEERRKTGNLRRKKYHLCCHVTVSRVENLLGPYEVSSCLISTADKTSRSSVYRPRGLTAIELDVRNESWLWQGRSRKKICFFVKETALSRKFAQHATLRQHASRKLCCVPIKASTKKERCLRQQHSSSELERTDRRQPTMGAK